MPRPSQYNPEAVTRTAMELFWERGFATTSVDHLVKRTGLNRHSLYSSFGGKDGLFTAGLQFYRQHQASGYLAYLHNERGARALRDYFNAVTAHPDSRGCLIANSVLEAELPEASREIILCYYDELYQALRRVLKEGQADGDLRPALNPEATARWLLTIIQGLSLQGRLQERQNRWVKLNADELMAMLTSP